MKGFRKFLNRLLEILGSIILAAMVLVVLYQVFARTVLKNPSTLTEEFVRFALVWLAMLASACRSDYDIWRLEWCSNYVRTNFTIFGNSYGLCLFSRSSSRCFDVYL